MRLILLSFLLALCLCYGPLLIKSHPARHVTRAVYAWQSDFRLGGDEQLFMERHGFSKVYVKIMDIGWSPVYGAYPMTATDISYELRHDSGMQVVPVVFITNEAVKHTALEDMPRLAGKITAKMDQLCDTTGKVRELQIDCDWTASSKERYFALLDELKKLRPQLVLSATIRLHQYKNSASTGVPPVHRGMLMMYNMGKIADYKESNSIFNARETLPYLVSAEEYPLPLDIALPTFNWGVVFRFKKFDRIIHHISRQMADTCAFLKKQPNGMYCVTADYWNDGQGIYLEYGDEIRIEEIDDKALLQAASMAASKSNSPDVTVSLFELSSHLMPQLDSTVYEKVFDHFK